MSEKDQIKDLEAANEALRLELNKALEDVRGFQGLLGLIERVSHRQEPAFTGEVLAREAVGAPREVSMAGDWKAAMTMDQSNAWSDHCWNRSEAFGELRLAESLLDWAVRQGHQEDVEAMASRLMEAKRAMQAETREYLKTMPADPSAV